MALRVLVMLITVSALACSGGGPGVSASPPAATAIVNACGPNPSPAPTVQPTEFSYRMIASPQANASLQSPLTVAGQANPFEGAFSVTVFNANGQQIAANNFNKSNLSLAFSVQLSFSLTAPTPACVWYHERSGRDGSPINITQVPVLLLP